MLKNTKQNNLVKLLNFSDLTWLSGIFGHDLGFKMIFGFKPGSGLYFRVRAGFGPELGGPFTTLTHVLQLGLNFAAAPTQIPTQRILAAVEKSLTKFTVGEPNHVRSKKIGVIKNHRPPKPTLHS